MILVLLSFNLTTHPTHPPPTRPTHQPSSIASTPNFDYNFLFNMSLPVQKLDVLKMQFKLGCKKDAA